MVLLSADFLTAFLQGADIILYIIQQEIKCYTRLQDDAVSV